MMAEPPSGVEASPPLGSVFHRRFPGSAEAIRDTLGEAQAWMTARGLPAILRAEAELVLAEVLNNIAEHAYRGGVGLIVLRLKPCTEGIFCLVCDYGAAMPGGDLPEGRRPGIDVARDDLPEGGFGWHLIRLLTSRLRYDRRSGCNRLGFVLDGRTWR